ncbi:branched-chain amino acid transaminase [Thiohalorhabdus methylotrophus]|uniref:Branched-chain-amino-acid aminotransferase n=1 Tax=Thiohalorhabdus methylotrophus TaxID=3242694 RepID=A0ABV4TRU9_9GAMM
MSMADRDGKIWMDGELVEWRDATTHVLTHTLHYGMGVFEGVRAYSTERGAAIFRLEEHTQRLFNSAHIMQMPMPYSRETINEAQRQVIRANGLDACYIRPLVFYGSEAMGLNAHGLEVHVVVAAWPWGAYLGDEGLKHGIRAVTSSYTRHHPNITMTKAKLSGGYFNSMLAHREAKEAGFDEAVLLDPYGYVSEGPGENIFMVRDGILYTPPLSTALDGITRKTVLELAREEGIEIREEPLTRDAFYIADEAFFSGTAAEVVPIREMDNRTIGGGSAGPVTQRLQTRYFDVVAGRDARHADWLDFVYQD